MKISEAERKLQYMIDQNEESAENSLKVAADGLKYTISDMWKSELNTLEQIDSIIEYLRNAESAIQRRRALKNCQTMIGCFSK